MKPFKYHKILPIATTIVISVFISCINQNCAKAQFSIDPNAKSKALGKESVFGTQPDTTQPVSDTPPAGDGSTSGPHPSDTDGTVASGNPTLPSGIVPIGSTPNIPTSITPINNDTSAPLQDVEAGFDFVCSNGRTQSSGGNLLTAEAVKIVILNQYNKIACELNGDFKSQILNTKKLSVTPCPKLSAGNYEAFLVDIKFQASSFVDYFSKSLNLDSIKFAVNTDGTYQVSTKKIDLLYDLNNQFGLVYDSFNKDFGNLSSAETQKKCDSHVSPLIISMNSESTGIKLSAPLDGIQFDILGANSFPMAHAKKQISWLTSADNEYYFIVLPNKDGKVLGIDEMFGDNTKGPDGKFAANGYAALAKYDTDQDGFITDKDSVYSDLRLWIDRNHDGVADSNELYTLKDKGVTTIDLHFDSSYKETDQYGNQSRMKSVVKTEDGQLHLLFDLWFRYLNITK